MSQMQRVIKAENAKIDGQVSLELKTAPASSSRQAGPACQNEAKIIEKNSQYMIVEITCTCGKKTLLRCEFE